MQKKKVATRVVEGCRIRIGCTNRPLGCCNRLLFLLKEERKKVSPAQEEGERNTHSQDERRYLYRCL